jgi:ketosteroid isomerase-like protein
MSEENIEVVRGAVESFNEGTFGSAAFFDAALVFEEPPEQPAPRVARGRDEAVRIFTEFEEAWAEHHSEPEEFRVIDDERVLLLTTEHFRGRDGIAIDQPCGTVFTVRNGKIVRMQAFWERANALAAAGVSA